MELVLDQATHSYSLNGVRIPGVSEILDWAGFSPPYPRTGDYKARGSAVHKATFLFDQGTLGKIDPRIEGYLASYKIFREEFPVKWDLMEMSAYHPTLLYAGTLDRGCETQSWIVDIKTGEPPKKRLGLQLAAYSLLTPLGTLSQRAGVQLFDDGSRPRLITCDDRQDFDVWLGLVHRYHWERKN
jgi:hypothetical protein